jgi:predicted amidohydrolase
VKLRIGLAALKQRKTVPDGVDAIVSVLESCQKQKVDIVCTPETYLPGLRGASFELAPPDQPAMEEALKDLRAACRRTRVAAIVGMEWQSERGLENRAFVISASGRLLGHQTKNQITPGGESENYVPDGQRKVFQVKGVRFGIVICHEGWRYPETVRWAALRGARIVFQPQVTGGDKRGKRLRKWGEVLYEKSMQCRAGENGIYFASVNQAMHCQNSATSLIDPNGECITWVPYGKEDLVVADIDTAKATRLYTKRYRPELYPD